MRSVGAVIPLMAGIAIATGSMHHPAVQPTVPALKTVAKAPSVNHTLVVTANDYAFTGMTTRVSAGWVTIRMINAGKELHMFASANVPAGMTTAGMLDSIMKDRVPKNFTEWGGPNAVAPGSTSTVTLYLQPGTYVVGCFVVSPDGKTHFMKGMMGSFDVVASRDAGTPPASDRNILLSTYHIAMDGGTLTKGQHVFNVRNTAKEPHDLVILKVLPGHTVAQALKWFGNPPVGAPAAEPIGGTTALHLNEQGYVQAKFTPGTYVLVCWMRTDNKPHSQLGMEKVLTVPAT
jgi:plastocyanin